VATALIGGFGLGVVTQATFLLPLRARELGAGYETVGTLVAAGALASVLVSLPLGSAIDRWGPKRSFLAGALSCALLGIAFSIATSTWQLFVLQFLLGGARTLSWVSSQAYVADAAVAGGSVGVTGRFVFVSNLSTIAGPLLAGAAAEVLGVGPAFLVITVNGVCFALLATRLARSPGGAGGPRSGAGSGGAVRLLAVPGMQVVLLLTFVRLWIEITWMGFVPAFLVESGLGPATAGTVASAVAITATVVAPTVGLWCRTFSKEAVTIAGLACSAAGLALAAHIVALPWVFLAPLLVGVGSGVSLPLLIGIVGDIAPAGRRGLALGLRQTANNLGGLAAPLLVGQIVAAAGIAVAFGVAGGVAAVVLAGAWARHARAAAGRAV
jgi:MFS family permease